MDTMTTMSTGDSVPTEKRVWLMRIGLVLVILGGLYGLWFAVKGMFEPHAPQKQAVTKIKILPDTPPPPPPKEPPKEQPKEQPKEVKMEQPKPQEAPQPPTDTVKSDEPAGDAPSPISHGPVTNENSSGNSGPGGNKIPAKKSMAAYAWFTGQVKTQIEDALEAEKGLSRAQYRLVVLVWISPDGQVSRSEVQGTSGDPNIDALIKKALAGVSRIGDAPPDDMPQPVKLRITSKNTG